MAVPQLALVAPSYADDDISIEFMIKRLELSGLVPEDVDAYPISSLRYDGVGSFCIPYRTEYMWRTRHDRAINKYLQPKNIRDIWWSPHQDPLKDKQDILFIIEGELKAARFVKRWPDINAVAIGGAWNGLERNVDGTRRLLTNLQLCLKPKMRVIIIYDGDIQTKPNIQMAASAMRHALQQHSCELELFCPPSGKGVDDWLQECPDAELTDLTPISFSQIEESRKQLYVSLGCSLNEDKLILNELNAKKILEHYFGGRIYRDKRLGVIKDGEVANISDLENACIEYMQGEINHFYKVPQVRTGLGMSLTQSRDLIQELVLGIEWDGVPRLETWGSEYLKSGFPKFANEWGRILMTGLALRILKPGTKVDHACILIGSQGIGKSTFFEELSRFDGIEFYYAVTDLSGTAGDANRTQGHMFTRSLIVDLAEGVIFETKKISMDRVKQMLTQTHDEYRVAYAKSPTIEPRGFIFVGTTNRTDQLGDQTGSRRYLNLEVDRIVRLPYAEKLQILAEVTNRESEIRASNWYDLRLDISDAPEELRAEYSHITNMQELINAQYHRSDVRADMVFNLIEAGDLAKLKDDGRYYITAGYLAAKLGEDSTQSKALCARTLSALGTSPTFPYKLTQLRKRLTQLDVTSSQMFAYTQGVANSQLMLNGLIVEDK
jgi:hypothetical protein